MNPILNSFFGSDLFGKVIFLSIFLLSIITWAIFLQKYFLYRDARKEGSIFVTIFQKNTNTPFNLEPNQTHPFALLYRTLKRSAHELIQKNQLHTLSHADMTYLKGRLSNISSTQIKRYQRNLFILSTVVSLAPFLGLLGTVWGILLTFGELQMGATLSANATMMGGLSMALGTTVFGLLVAIPALIAYNYLRASSSQLATEMEDFSEVMLSTVELHYRKVDV